MNLARWLLLVWCMTFAFLDGWWAAGHLAKGETLPAAIVAAGAVVMLQLMLKGTRDALREAYARGQLAGLNEARDHLVDAAKKAGVLVSEPDPREDIR